MMKKENELFWNSSINEMKNGYIEEKEVFKCLICGEEFIKGKIYNINSELYEAKKAVQLHIKEKHISILTYLLNMNPSFTGISEVQKEVVTLISKGLSDKEIAKKLGVAQSTIRNHRYKLREKEKQSKIFLAMMELLNKETNKKINKLENENICDAHKTATTLDDRFNITDKEKLEVIKNYINENGSLKNYPAKEKKKIIVLEEISKSFSNGRVYTEREVNRILKRIYEDNATIRRALIEYGFIERSNDCKNYWVKE
ncbi:DUF2087 domain-containing protein [Clostridium tarantellae]|uniref:DUF2087 domain-containing protein n=1 Tax=Clostridium tarantellae TaxID=39493 RepID=A0A6I1MPD7_9CLOT|nr:DUF2087 domain-containing protein [Clostridium tarantellae]MPQ44934.1 DUF2087 domain-containing protein [Clostridium tarantellae]